MFSQTAEYALRAIAHLSMNTDTPQTTQQIAAATRTPMPYLSKVLQSMGKADLIHAQRGLHGGFTLLRSPDQITVYDVIQSVDPIKRIMTCPLGLASHGTHLCPLHKRLDDAIGLVEKQFRETTIAEMLNEPTTSRPLCPFPVEPAS